MSISGDIIEEAMTRQNNQTLIRIAEICLEKYSDLSGDDREIKIRIQRYLKELKEYNECKEQN